MVFSQAHMCLVYERRTLIMVETLTIIGLVLGITASICRIAFTYYQYRKSKQNQETGPSDAGTSDRPDNGCHKDN